MTALSDGARSRNAVDEPRVDDATGRALAGIRVLDLADERGLLVGRLLADLGADVVAVEPPTGNAARRRSPRHPDGNGSYHWDAFAANKRGIVADLDTDAGQETVLQLARLADVVIDSEGPAVQTARGLDWSQLAPSNAALVYVSLTPFGRTGPKSGWVDSDLVLWAAGGVLDEHRDGGRPPVRISLPQAYLHGCLDAAAGVQLALLARRRTGRGQLVDVSVQATLGAATLAHVLAHANGDHPRDMVAGHTLEAPARIDQSGSGTGTDPTLRKWRCADGLIEYHISIGPTSGPFTNRMWSWLRQEGVDLGEDSDLDFTTLPDLMRAGTWTDADTVRVRSRLAEFFRTRTKAEVLAAAVKHRLLCVPIMDLGDVRGSTQLASRGYWAEVGDGDRHVVLPGDFVHSADPLTAVTRPAPLLGEHDAATITGEWAAAAAGPPVRPAAPEGTADELAPLAGLKVLDLSWVVAGPAIGRTLADFGATVIRVETSRRVETARLMQPYVGGEFGIERSLLYGQWNAGKLGLTLDLQTERGRGIARELAGWADVVVESFSPGLLARWGLDYDTLAADRPELIMLSSTINGQQGPISALAGYGNVGAALSGFQAIVGYPDGAMLGPFGPYTDYLGPRFGTLGLLAALERREASGRGTYVDISQVEAGVWLLAPEVADFAANATTIARMGNADRDHAPHGVYRTRAEDRFVAVAVTTDAQWARLSAIIGRDDLAARSELATAAGRIAAAAELDAALEAWTRTRTAEAVEQELQAAGVPAHRSASSADYCADEQLEHLAHLVTLPHPLFGQVVVEGPRMRLGATPGAVRRAAPTFGQDNAEILGGLLGYSPQQIAELVADGVLR